MTPRETHRNPSLELPLSYQGLGHALRLTFFSSQEQKPTQGSLYEKGDLLDEY